MSRYDDGQYDEREDAWELRALDDANDLADFRHDQALQAKGLWPPPSPVSTTEPSEDDRCGMCNKRRATTGGLCGACNASASEPAWMTRAWGG